MSSILLNGRNVPYEFERKQVRNINLRIRADGTVYVSANDRVPLGIIEAFLEKKASYILGAIDKYAELSEYVQTDRAYVTGESYRYLGKNLRLQVLQGNTEVLSDGVYIYLATGDIKDYKQKANLINKWYDVRCREIFPQIVDKIYPIFSKYKVTIPKLILRNMTSRWGSCQPKRGCITLNKRLIEVPLACIEYVIMHEFIHFLQPHHSKKFYELLSTLMPDWKERKHILENGEYHQIITKKAEAGLK